jgi:hypothetical protein
MLEYMNARWKNMLEVLAKEEEVLKCIGNSIHRNGQKM